MGKGGKSGVGKALGIAGLATGAFAPWVFGMTSGWSAAIYGLSLGTTIASAFQKDSTETSKFDAKMNNVDNTARVPLLYGTRKIGGQQTYHHTDSDAQYLLKDVVLGEGSFSGCYGITANNYLCKLNGNSNVVYNDYNLGGTYNSTVSNGDNPIFGLINWKHTDAKVGVFDTDSARHLALYANGVETDIRLRNPSDLANDASNDYQCYMANLYQYIMGDNYDTPFAADGWKIIYPVATQDNPDAIGNTDWQGCYKKAAMFTLRDYQTGNSWITFHDGTQSAPDYYLQTGGYPNMAYLHAYLTYTDKIGSGNPTLTCIAQGRKVYDTRTKTWGYSENPAMIVRDYLINTTFGAGRFITEDMLDEDSFISAANYCDALVTVYDANGNTVTEPRYRLNILITDTKSYLQILEEMLKCFAGFVTYTNGKVSLKIEQAQNAVYDFDDDNIVQGSLVFETDAQADMPNELVMNYVEPALNWVSCRVKAPDLVNQHDTGKIISKEVQLTGVTSQIQAMRLGKIYRDLVRLCPIKLTFKTAAQALHLEPGDVVTISHDIVLDDGTTTALFTKMPFRILQIVESLGQFEIVCKQYNASIYDDSITGCIQSTSYVGTVDETTLLPTAVPDPTDLALSTVYHQNTDGSVYYDLVASYDLPDGYGLENGLVYYKVSDQVDLTTLGVIPEGVSADEIGFSTDWIYAGDSPNKVTILNATVGTTYKLMVLSRNKKGDISSQSTAPTAAITIAHRSVVPNTPQNFVCEFADSFKFSWNAVTNSDVDFYELRLDTNAGSDTGLLTRTTSLSAIVSLINRSATVYLYAHNATKQYGYPAMLTYNMPKLDAPVVTVASLLRGINISVGSLPNTAKSVNFYVTAEGYANTFNVASNIYAFQGDVGLYTITAAYVDLFGEGDISKEVTASIVATIDPAWIANESIALEKVDSSIKTSLAAGDYSKEKVDVVISNLNSSDLTKSDYSALVQLADDINLSVKKDDVINQINVSTEGITIDGQNIHITGKTVIDNNIITDNMIQTGAIVADKIASNAITADKIAAGAITGDSISANVSLNAPVITGGTISGNEIKASTLTAPVITGGTIKASTLDAESIESAGFTVHAFSVLKGVITGSGCIPLPNGYTQDECIWGIGGPTTMPSAVFMIYMFADQNRDVVAKISTDGTSVHDMAVNYWIMGVK